MANRHEHFRRPRHRRPFEKGDLKYIILDLIKEKPSYGYEIIQVLEERSHGFYAPSPGTVYPTLQLLEELGHISATQQESKRIYAITDNGEKFLVKHKKFAEGIKTQMNGYWNPESIGDMGETMRMYKELWNLLHSQARHANAKQLKLIRKAMSRTYKEIEDILE